MLRTDYVGESSQKQICLIGQAENVDDEFGDDVLFII